MAQSKSHFFLGIVRKVIYLLVLSGVSVYLYSLGSEPWIHLQHNWRIFLVLSVINGGAIFVQAASFREVQPPESLRLSLFELTRIWSLSGVVSVIAPVFASLGARTTLLVQSGMNLTACVIASARQLWMGLECAVLTGWIAIFFVEFPSRFPLMAALIVAWLLMIMLRLYAVGSVDNQRHIYWRWLASLKAPVSGRAHLLFIVQMLAMSSIYYVAFNGLGASLEFEEAVLLSAITVLASLIVVIPNGFGVLDTLWVLLATRAGLELEAAISLALMLRLAYFSSTIVVWGGVVGRIKYRSV